MATTKKARQTRQYIQLAEASKKSILTAIDSFNRVYGDYKVENTLMLLANAWELLAKSILVKKKKSIYKDQTKSETISCEKAINQLVNLKELDEQQAALLQQIISLRNRCVHDVLPAIPQEIQHHLFFYGCKFYKDLAIKTFPKSEDDLAENFLTLSFDHMTTYAAEVNKMVGRLRRGSQGEKELVWLLERGIRYVDTNEYISQKKFEGIYNNKKKISPHLKITQYMEHADMVRVVPVQAPQNYTADLSLRKGPKNMREALPVTVQKSDIDNDYPYLTIDIAEKINKSKNYVARAMAHLKMKDNTKYHHSMRASRSGAVQRYSQAALDYLKKHINENPQYDPYQRSAQRQSITGLG